jgi:integrase
MFRVQARIIESDGALAKDTSWYDVNGGNIMQAQQERRLYHKADLSAVLQLSEPMIHWLIDTKQLRPLLLCGDPLFGWVCQSGLLARRLKIRQPFLDNSWHTFRRTYASLLASSGTDVKVVQELLRHANVSTTMNLYAQAYSLDARTAQNRVVEMMFDAKLDSNHKTPEAVASPTIVL